MVRESEFISEDFGFDPLLVQGEEEQEGVFFCPSESTLVQTCLLNKQWEVIALEQLTSHMTLNAGPQQQRLESPTITPPGMR